jgi:hypothetical protein
MTPVIPRALAGYPSVPGQGLLATLATRVELEPFNAIATAIFAAAIVHIFTTARFTAWSQRVQTLHDRDAIAQGRPTTPSVAAESLRFLGEVEVVFGLWAIGLLVAMTAYAGWAPAEHYINETVNYTEALLVVVVMALASTRPIITFAESALRRVAELGGATPAAWWAAVLTIGPLLGSFISEPAAMTICAVLLARCFYDLQPSTRLKYATLGLLFVNVSVGGTVTHFAAPPVLMVARLWGWSTPYMASHFGWRAALAIVASTAAYLLIFRRELAGLAKRPPLADVEQPDEDVRGPVLQPVPFWVTLTHIGFLAWTVVNSHSPALFLGGFLFFLGFARATAAYQSRLELKAPLLVGFFLAGLLIHGGLQGWWIAPVLGRLSEPSLFTGSALLTTFNDNALITYLATLVPNLGEHLRVAVVEGAVVGGGLTVIANAPNPAGQALLRRFFDESVSPLGLAAGALIPTIIAAGVFRLL